MTVPATAALSVLALAAAITGAAALAGFADEAMPGGAATSLKPRNANAFSQSSANLPAEQLLAFRVGDGIFRKQWVSAPSSTHSSDGLGPLFNARATGSVAVQGLSALERALFEPEERKQLATEPYRCQWLAAIATNLAAMARETLAEWTDRPRTTRSISSPRTATAASTRRRARLRWSCSRASMPPSSWWPTTSSPARWPTSRRRRGRAWPRAGAARPRSPTATVSPLASTALGQWRSRGGQAVTSSSSTASLASRARESTHKTAFSSAAMRSLPGMVACSTRPKPAWRTRPGSSGCTTCGRTGIASPPGRP
ncbi:MAG: hypothetical protein IT563_00165 [Alphaproteobacteria bacterium]|nr:hypothetical protein [Alphaproteobacteria bacterium]